VHPHPADIWVLADPDRFDLRDLHMSNSRAVRLMPLAGSTLNRSSSLSMNGKLFDVLIINMAA
jgi:hypothetical protein